MTITTPAGFRAAGVAAGLKSTGAKDVALVVNDGPTFDSASVFTANRCKANPVLWSQEVVKDGTVRAVFLNSGGANCYTGPEGFQTTHAVAETVAERLGIGAHRRGRLLDRPDRAHQRPRRRCSPARPRRTTPSRPTAATQAARGDHDHRLGEQAGRRRGRRLVDRRDGQGRRHARAPAGHDAGRAHHRRRRTGRRPRHRAARRDPGQLRPARLRRLHVHQRHRDRARQRRERDHAVAAGLHRGAHPGLHRPRDAAAPRRRGRRPRDRDHRAQRRHRGRGGRGRPQRGPLQPLQGRRLRQRPQLGPRARQHRYDAGGVRPRRPRRRDERRVGVQAVHAARRPRDRRPEAARGERDHRPEGRLRAGHGLDQRPDPRLRPREQRVLAHERLAAPASSTPASPTRRRPAPSRPRCRG